MTQSPDLDQIDLRQYLSVLRRRKVVIALVAAVIIGSAVIVSLLQTPIYEASAEVLLQERASERIFSADEQGTPQRQSQVPTAIEVMESRSVVDAVREALLQKERPAGVGSPAGNLPVSIAAQGDTDVVSISAHHENADWAATIANTYATTYIEVRRTLLVNDLLGAGQQVQEQINAIDERLATLDPASPQSQGLLMNRASYTQTLDRLQLSGSIQTGGAQLVSEALPSGAPIRPTPARNAALALIVGLILGVGVAFLLEQLDDTVKDKNDLERSTDGLTALALVPTVTSWKDRSEPYVVSLREPTSAASEAYRSLRTSVQFLGIDRPLHLIQLTSPNPGEGKSTTLANLAVSLARAGQRVAVVCCDLRRPRIHEFFELDNSIGFTSVLLGQSSLSDALQRVPSEPGVALLASGPPPPNPSELLSSSRDREVFGLLAAQFDVVLIDTPPVLPVTDGLIISNLVDATILVATAKRSTRKDTHRAMELLRQVDAPLVGTVLNGVESEAMYGYGGYGGYSVYGGHSTERPDEGRPNSSALQTKAARSDSSKRTASVAISSEPYPGSS